MTNLEEEPLNDKLNYSEWTRATKSPTKSPRIVLWLANWTCDNDCSVQIKPLRQWQNVIQLYVWFSIEEMQCFCKRYKGGLWHVKTWEFNEEWWIKKKKRKIFISPLQKFSLKQTGLVSQVKAEAQLGWWLIVQAWCSKNFICHQDRGGDRSDCNIHQTETTKWLK